MKGLPTTDWTELLELHVVKKVAKLANRRWNLGVGWVDAATGQVAPPRTNEHAVHRGPCQVLQDSTDGRHACSETARRTLERFAADAARGHLGVRPVQLTCHAGLVELAAPVIVDGTFIGALLCGGFYREEDLQPGSRESLSLLGEHQPRLGRREISFVGELVEEAAAEIASVLASRVGGGRTSEALRHSYDMIIGSSEPMQALYSLLDKVVASESTVLITGENGTGKELVARAIHYNSPRKKRRFVVQNCSAFNDNLLDSELFGHKRGAFTGAVSDKKGLFEVADNGTFFLDEIGDMSPALQVKVLRVLQEGTFTPVGDTETQKVDVRILAATNRDLKTMVERGEFREDLYYRINVINLTLPSLRERPSDVEQLATYFLRKHAPGTAKRLSDECLARLQGYNWPGNVRELENEVERLVVLAGDADLLGVDLLSARIQAASPSKTPMALASEAEPSSLPEAVRALEQRMIRDALVKHGWNKTRAAADLQISRRNLIRLVQKYELERNRNRDTAQS